MDTVEILVPEDGRNLESGGIAPTFDITPPSDRWFIQIYDVSSSAAQEVIVGLFALVDNLTVEAASSGPDHYAIIECSDESQARSVHDLVMAVDPNAKLVHSTGQTAPRATVVA